MGDRIDTSALNSDSKVLIINTAFLGDICLTSYLVEAIKMHYQCEITLLTTPNAAEMMKFFSSIDNILIFDKRDSHSKIKDVINFAKKISNLGFTHILSLHKSMRTSHLVKNIESGLKLGFDTSERASVYDIKIPYKFHLHEVRRYLEFLVPFGINVNLSDIKIKLTIEEEESLYIDNLLIQEGLNLEKPIIALAPGSVWETKKWGNNKYLELSDMLLHQYNVVLIGSKNDQLEKEVPNAIINLIGKTSIRDIFYIFKKSSAVVTNDSAPTHIASVLNKPVVTIYGPTDPIFGFYPLSDKSVSVKNYSLKCSPCDIHGQNSCPLGTHKCMKSIKSDLIYQEIEKLSII